MSHARVQTTITLIKNLLTTDLKTTYDAETNNTDVEKIKSRPKQKFEDQASNTQLDKDILNKQLE